MTTVKTKLESKNAVTIKQFSVKTHLVIFRSPQMGDLFSGRTAAELRFSANAASPPYFGDLSTLTRFLSFSL